MAHFALGKGWNVALFTPRISPLRELVGSDHVFGPYKDTSQREEVENMLADLRQQPVPCLVLADDIEVISSDSWLLNVLAAHVTSIRDSGSLFVGAGSPTEISASYSGLAQTLKRARSGVMLCPLNISEAEMFGARLERSAFGQSLPPGGGYIVRAGTAERVPVIWPGE
jgi:S-DNA-T family DNA segregation ATPase FtsK/SpoIIIE